MGKGPAEYFRAGVGVVVANAEGLVLALERSDVPGAWQFPQGGLESRETPEQGALRELREETGLRETSVRLVDAYPEPLAYELPLEARSARTGRGQALYWFLARIQVPDSDIRLPEGGEFARWRWLPFEGILETVVSFRKPSYQKLAERFRLESADQGR